MKYIDIQKNWRRIKPFLQDDNAKALIKHGMYHYHMNRKYHFESIGVDTSSWKYTGHELPCQYESCDWRWDTERQEPQPAFWDYVCHSACHWLVDLNFYAAINAFPKNRWVIVSNSESNDGHSNVVDFENKLIFDMNYLAMGIEPMESLEGSLGKDDSSGGMIHYGFYDHPDESLIENYIPPDLGEPEPEGVDEELTDAEWTLYDEKITQWYAELRKSVFVN